MKQEAAEAKKAEEKAKREAIYQDYLRRKGKYGISCKQRLCTKNQFYISIISSTAVADLIGIPQVPCVCQPLICWTVVRLSTYIYTNIIMQ